VINIQQQQQQQLYTLFNNLRDVLSNEGYQRMEQTLQ